MKNKIDYFMARNTRLVFNNLSKVIIDENEVLINYTILRQNFKDEETTVINYTKDKNRMIIYDKLKKYNSHVYEGFIEWANEKRIKWYIVGEEEI